jgi:hypothetical protein
MDPGALVIDLGIVREFGMQLEQELAGFLILSGFTVLYGKVEALL